MPIGYTPRTPGRFLICAYTNDGATATLTTAALTVDVRGAATPAPAPSRKAEGSAIARTWRHFFPRTFSTSA